ncbi:MAG: UDP-GlcNAc--UDP-phosphate GlcNAc-1-phosphate transferase [Flavobacterium sp.]|nr:UDP-GlcNAc--UDP-phosphate GlcNAc-1-phosphate transferase [Flavobacterium sp.]
MHYIIITFLLVFSELLYFRIADRYNIIDKPNHRSSHSRITLRGGGIIFPIAVLLSYLFGDASWPLALAIVLVAVISFIDDLKPLPQLPRFGSQIIAFLLVAYDLHLFEGAFWLLPVVMVFLIGWINAFNFMDGINGITVLYALTAIISFSVLPVHETSVPLLVTVGLSCLVFGFFNVRKIAKTFAGDVGSISLALFLGYFMIKTIIDSGQIGFILFFSIYGIDAVITILYRIQKKENIFEAHRTHLYQYLANELGYSQILISSLYAALQVLVNAIIICLYFQGNLTLPIVLCIVVVLALAYLAVRSRVFRRACIKNQ